MENVISIAIISIIFSVFIGAIVFEAYQQIRKVYILKSVRKVALQYLNR